MEAASRRPKRRRRAGGDHEAARDEQRIEHEQRDVADEAELLRIHREDEVGVPLRDELEVRLRAVQPALAGEAARAHGDRGLDDVVAGAERIARRVEQREDPAALVVVQERPQQRQRGGAGGGDGADHPPAHPGEENDEEPRRADEPRGAEVGLAQDQAERHEQQDAGDEVVAQRAASFRSCGSTTPASAATASFIISEGWKRVTPTCSQRRAPFTTSPASGDRDQQGHADHVRRHREAHHGLRRHLRHDPHRDDARPPGWRPAPPTRPGRRSSPRTAPRGRPCERVSEQHEQRRVDALGEAPDDAAQRNARELHQSLSRSSSSTSSSGVCRFSPSGTLPRR